MTALATIISLDPPWICHMLIVILATVILDRPKVRAWISISAAWMAGLAGIWILQLVSLNGRGWWDVWYYWQLLHRGLQPAKLQSDPGELIAVLGLGHLLPLALATAVWWFRHRYWGSDLPEDTSK